MNIVELINSIDPLLDGEIDRPLIRLRLTKVRIAAEELERQLAKARAAHDKSNADYRKVIRQKTALVNKLARLADDERLRQ